MLNLVTFWIDLWPEEIYYFNYTWCTLWLLLDYTWHMILDWNGIYVIHNYEWYRFDMWVILNWYVTWYICMIRDGYSNRHGGIMIEKSHDNMCTWTVNCWILASY